MSDLRSRRYAGVDAYHAYGEGDGVAVMGGDDGAGVGVGVATACLHAQASPLKRLTSRV